MTNDLINDSAIKIYKVIKFNSLEDSNGEAIFSTPLESQAQALVDKLSRPNSVYKHCYIIEEETKTVAEFLAELLEPQFGKLVIVHNHLKWLACYGVKPTNLVESLYDIKLNKNASVLDDVETPSEDKDNEDD